MKIAPLIGYAARGITGTTIRENLTSAKTQLATLLATESRFHPDIVFTFMDLSMEAESLGLKISMPEDENFTVLEHPIKNVADLKAFGAIGQPEGRAGIFIETVRGFKKASATEIGAFIIGPFSLAGIMIGLKELSVKMMSDPELVFETAGFCSEYLSRHAANLRRAGADYIVILEPTCAMFSGNHFNRFAAPNISRLCDPDGGKTVIHVCGDTAHLFGCFAKLDGVSCVSLDSMIDLRKAHHAVQKTVLGNIPPVLVSRATPEEIGEAVAGLMARMEGVDDYIVSTGCNLPPESPAENISAFMEAARKCAACR